MTTGIDNATTFQMTRPLMKAVVVSKYPGRNLPEGVLDADSFDIVFIESTARAYSQIKRVSPDLVIMCIAMDDPDSCGVLSMLKLDRETRHIPIATYMTISSSVDERHKSDRVSASL